jgi:hypothetical protein
MKTPMHAMLLPVLDRHGALWELADDALAAELSQGPITVRDGTGTMDRAGCSALRDLVAAKLEAVRAQTLAGKIADGFGAVLRESLHGHLKRFCAAARTWWGNTNEAAAIPEPQPVDRNLDKFLRPVRDALRLWDRLNAGPAPTGVTLPLTIGPENLDRAGMASLMAQLLETRDHGEEAAFLLKIARRDRDRTERRALAILSLLQKTITVRLGSDHPVAVSMPPLYPPSPPARRRKTRKQDVIETKDDSSAKTGEPSPAPPTP